MALLELALPSQALQRVGILVLDLKRDQLFCKVDNVSVIDNDASELLACLVDDLEAQARQKGGKVVLEYLQDTLSNVLRISDSTRLYVSDPREAANLLGTMAIGNGAVANSRTPTPGVTVSTIGLDVPGPSQVLLVEDNPADILLIQEGFRMCQIDTTFTVATDGEAAIGLLDSIGRDVPKPDLILLDINIPKRNGFEVLKSFRASPQLSKTPISMLTSSIRGVDFERALQSGANCYALKANDLEGLSRTIGALSTYCLHLAIPAGFGFMPQIGGTVG